MTYHLVEVTHKCLITFRLKEFKNLRFFTFVIISFLILLFICWDSNYSRRINFCLKPSCFQEYLFQFIIYHVIAYITVNCTSQIIGITYFFCIGFRYNYLCKIYPISFPVNFILFHYKLRSKI